MLGMDGKYPLIMGTQGICNLWLILGRIFQRVFGCSIGMGTQIQGFPHYTWSKTSTRVAFMPDWTWVARGSPHFLSLLLGSS